MTVVVVVAVVVCFIFLLKICSTNVHMLIIVAHRGAVNERYLPPELDRGGWAKSEKFEE